MTEENEEEEVAADVPWWRGWSRAKKLIVAAAAATGLPFIGAIAGVLVPDVMEHFKPDFDLSVQRNVDLIQTREGAVGGSYILLRPIDDVGAPPGATDTCEGRYTWARAEGAVVANATIARVSLKALKSGGVEVAGVEVVDLVRRSPMTGTYLACPGRGGSPEIRTINVELDESPPRISASNPDGTPVAPVFSIAQHESEIFDVTAGTVSCDCEWRLKVRLRVGGHDRVRLISDADGKPFRTSSSVNARAYRWGDGRWVDVEANPAQQPQQSPSAPQSQSTPTPKPSEVRACSLLSLQEVSAKLVGEFAYGAGYDIDTQGASVPVHESMCSMDEVRPLPDPQQGGALDGVNLVYAVAGSEADARAEFAARLTRYGSGAQPESVAVADEAAFLEGVLVARKGAALVTVIVNSTDASRRAGARELGLIAVRAAFMAH